MTFEMIFPFLVLSFIFSISSAMCAFIAKKTGRNAVKWGLIGFFTYTIGVGLLLASICRQKAREQRRSKIFWTLAGFFAGPVAFFILYLLGNKKRA